MNEASFYEKPILNSPYQEPSYHHDLDDDGQPRDTNPISGRRRSELITPIPKARKKKSRIADTQDELGLFKDDGLSTEDQQYDPTPIINEIRTHVKSWREIRNPSDWGVTPATQRLLSHWRTHEFEGIRPFFCQVEAIETIIWLTEVARKQGRYKKYWEHIQGANEQSNPELIRLAMKMATGAGKTTVMAMLIAWQVINARRSASSKLFTTGFLIVAPGITIRDRLRVLLPSDPDSYYKTRELVPADMLNDLGKAQIVITNYHAFQLRETDDTNKINRGLRQGRGQALKTTETEGEMIHRVAKELMGIKNIVVINDEAHHCYREKPGNTEVADLKGDEKTEAKKDNEEARVWINGLEAFKRKLGVRAVYDLSATPFFLRGSGYAEGTLFPWTVSDFSLMDAIECGIVKLPRIPVADNIPDAEVPVFRELWEHIGKLMPKKGRGGGGGQDDPNKLPELLKSALIALYGDYREEATAWERGGVSIPPVMIVVCNNTASSKLVYEWISGWDEANEDGDLTNKSQGNLDLFSNYDKHGNRLPLPKTLLIDSAQLESGDALSPEFRKAASVEIQQFKQEINVRRGSGEVGEISDSELLREVMNTVGKKGKLGEQVRCVVSVSMLTEGWDANNVTHILGVRAFGTQLLCEQVVGRGLRRYSYDPVNPDDTPENWMFDVEYSNVLGIPFSFATGKVKADRKQPKDQTRVMAMKERAALEITFPRATGYRIDLPNEKLRANFNADSTLVVTPDLIGPSETLLSGIVGKDKTLTLVDPRDMRPSTVVMELSKHLLNKFFTDENGEPKLHLFNQIHRIARQWIDGNHLVCKGDLGPWTLSYTSIADQAAERIYNAIASTIGDTEQIKAILDPYNPTGSSSHVGFNTTKDTYTTDPRRCHINAVVSDSEWEAEFARVAEAHPKVITYVKNQGLNFEIPYMDGSVPRKYIPDFIVRIDDGGGPDDPLNLIVEVKGYRDENVKLKSETTKNQWVPGVNNLRVFGRWAFVEFGDVFEFGKGLDDVLNQMTMATGE